LNTELTGDSCHLKPAATETENRQLTNQPTLRDTLTCAIAQFDASPHLRADASRDALVLLLHATGLTRAAYHANPDRFLTPEQSSTYDALIARRLAHEPIQYITGEQEFYSLPFRVTPAVLIPRPETEHIVETVLAELRPRDQSGDSLRIVDVGTGSGAIAVALAVHLPRAQITALDISPAALEVAAANAERNGVAGRIRFLQSDLLSGVSGEPAFDVVVSNPPYVPNSDRSTLHPQVRDHEPSGALFAGPDGLDIYHRLIPQARAALAPNGLLALEIGFGQRNAIAALLADWSELRFVEDLQHTPRVALARKP
jgi:release factor glutamine methyltransferase